MESKELPTWAVVVVGIVYFLALLALLATALLYWPGDTVTNKQIIAAIMVAGALGAVLNGAWSFTWRAGKNELHTSWIWWHVLRAPMGAGLGLFLYVVIRAGYFSGSAATDDLNVYGAAAISGLAGLASKPAILKLRDIARTAFNPVTDETRTIAPEMEAALESFEKAVANAQQSAAAAAITKATDLVDKSKP